MLDMLVGPAKEFLKLGIEKYRKNKEFKNLKIAVQDRVRREVNFNLELLADYSEAKDEKDTDAAKVLLQALRTEAFDQLDAGVLPLILFFEEKLEQAIWSEPENKKFMQRVDKVKTQCDLVQRVYHRIRVSQTLAACGKERMDDKYMRFLLRALLESIKSTEIKK